MAQIRSWLSIMALEFGWKEPRRTRAALTTASHTPPSALPSPRPGAMSQTPSVKRSCRREPTPAPGPGPLAGAAPAPDPARPPVRVPGFKKFPPPTLPPPPLLDLLERHPDLFAMELLARLPPAARTSFARAGRVCRDAVFPRFIFPNGLSRARNPGRGAVRVFKLRKFLVSGERLAWAKANGFLWDTQTTALAARGGHLEALQWARAHDCPWTAKTCADAAYSGHLKVLKWAREHHCPWDKLTCASAASRGHLKVLKWARRHGCPWKEEEEEEEEQEEDDEDDDCCALAAQGGHLEVLKWLREHHCPWNARTCAGAAVNGDLKMVKWARENGCPWDEDTCNDAASGGHLKVLRYAHRNNCPPVGCSDMRKCRSRRAPGDVAVAAKAQLPVGRGYVHA